MKVALVHDWLIHMRGGERVLEALAEVYPDATLYTLFYDRKKLSPALQRMKIKASFLNSVPRIKYFYRWLLPFLPRVIKSIKIDPDTELVISSSHCVAKGIKIPRGTKHLCYCHTPMRYLWGYEDEYFGSGLLKKLRPFLGGILENLRQWDLSSNQGVDYFVSNAENVKNRIHRFYHRDACVVYPPLDMDKFKKPQNSAPSGNYYLVVSAFVPYKRVDLVIEAFNSLDRDLWIVGSGPLASYYKELVKSPRIRFLGPISDEELQKVYAGAKALLFPTEEDFGIVPLEAQACGTPVIAFRKGGALESVKSGLFFAEQTAASIIAAVKEFEQKKFDPAEVASKINSFAKPRFKKEIMEVCEKLMRGEYQHVAG